MRRGPLAIAWSTLVWVTLWEDFTWANFVGGVFVATLVILVVPLRPLRFTHRVRPLALGWLSIYFVWKLIEASTLMAWEVITPRNRVNPAVVSVPLRTRSLGVATMVANMVSLTPGTLTLEVDHETMTLIMHVLHMETVEKSRQEVLHLEALAMAALPVRSGKHPEGMG
jgi:multicomponent Na+:H+ antiporter subunit E